MNYKSDDYRKDYRQVEDDAVWTGKRVLKWGIVLVVALMVVGFVISMLSKPAQILEKSTDPDHVISNYEEFQNMYNACQKLNTDLGTIRAVPDTDPMFSQFSKSAMIAAKRQQMSRWAEEYNAKSKMLNRKYWKSTTLPYQLSVDEFSNYADPKGGV